MTQRNYVYPNGTGTMQVGDLRLQLTRIQVVNLAMSGVELYPLEASLPLPVRQGREITERAVDALRSEPKKRERWTDKPRQPTRVVIIAVCSPDGEQSTHENMMAWVRETFPNETSKAYFAIMRYGKYAGYTVQKLESRNVSIPRTEGRHE